MNKAKALLIVLIGIIVVLSLTRIVVSNIFAVDGIQLDQMQQQISLLNHENMILSEKVYTSSSLTNIASNASSLGFVEEKSQVALSNSSPLALKQ